MKKLLSIILVIVCIFSIVACGKKEEKPFFVSKVIEISDTTILLEVTNNGNCSINEGGQVVIPLDKIAGVISENKDFVIIFSSKKTHRLACEMNCLLIFYC